MTIFSGPQARVENMSFHLSKICILLFCWCVLDNGYGVFIKAFLLISMSCHLQNIVTLCCAVNKKPILYGIISKNLNIQYIFTTCTQALTIIVKPNQFDACVAMTHSLKLSSVRLCRCFITLCVLDSQIQKKRMYIIWICIWIYDRYVSART